MFSVHWSAQLKLFVVQFLCSQGEYWSLQYSLKEYFTLKYHPVLPNFLFTYLFIL